MEDPWRFYMTTCPPPSLVHPYQLPYMEQWDISVAHPAMCNWSIKTQATDVYYDKSELTNRCNLDICLELKDNTEKLGLKCKNKNN